jgi:hypothetical protein
LIAAIPSAAQKNDRRLEVVPQERRVMLLLPEDDLWEMMDELKRGL